MWDRSLLRCASAPWPHAHLREGRGREERIMERVREREEVLSVTLIIMSWR